MEKDRLTIKTELQKEFEGKDTNYIDTNIALYKLLKFFYAESTIFCLSLVPTLCVIAYYFVKSSFGVGSSFGIVLLLVHYVVFKTLFMKVLFKDAGKTYDELEYTIEVLNDIKSAK